MEKIGRPGGLPPPQTPPHPGGLRSPTPASPGAAPPGPPAIYEGLRPSNSPIFMEYGMLTQTFLTLGVKTLAKI